MQLMNEIHIETVRKYALQYNLDPALICAVVEQESNWDTYAARYEPAFYKRYIQPLLDNGTVKTATEAMDRSTSFGLMQVMGQTAREQGFTGQSLFRLCNPDVGLEMGCKVLRHKIDAAGGDLKAGLLLYNGGGAPEYPVEVLARMPKYQDRTVDHV